MRLAAPRRRTEAEQRVTRPGRRRELDRARPGALSTSSCHSSACSPPLQRAEHRVLRARPGAARGAASRPTSGRAGRPRRPTRRPAAERRGRGRARASRAPARRASTAPRPRGMGLGRASRALWRPPSETIAAISSIDHGGRPSRWVRLDHRAPGELEPLADESGPSIVEVGEHQHRAHRQGQHIDARCAALDRRRDKAERLAAMTEFSRIGVVGAGFMGSGIAESAAAAGRRRDRVRARAGAARAFARVIGRVGRRERSRAAS